MKTCILVDLDGTLANIDHRLHYISNGKRDWPAFFGAASKDMPIPATTELFNSLREVGHNIVIVTARPDDYISETTLWLSRWSLTPDALYMRKANDKRKDSIVKKEILDQLRYDGWQPLFVVDDRQQVVDMWKENNIPVFQFGGAQPPEQKVNVVGKDLLHIMVGPTGAGKSTYLLTACTNNRQGYDLSAVVSSDEIRHELCGNFRDQSKNDLVFELLRERVALRMKYGLFTVVDATNLYRKDRLAITNLCPREALVKYVVVDRPLKEKLKTAGWRLEVPGLIEKHDQRFRSQLKDILSGDGLPNVTVLDTRKEK